VQPLIRFSRDWWATSPPYNLTISRSGPIKGVNPAYADGIMVSIVGKDKEKKANIKKQKLKNRLPRFSAPRNDKSVLICVNPCLKIGIGQLSKLPVYRFQNEYADKSY